MKKNSLTILHLSDLQFGKNHKFYNPSQAKKELSCDTLQVRLQCDLKILKQDYSLEPDLIIVTGDIAECGKKSEFNIALSFFNELSSSLNIDKSHFIIIPGNHDINRKACEAYFAECEADENEATLPYKPKWRHFDNFCKQFYLENSGGLNSENHFHCIEYPLLKVAVASLNSTMKESHQPDDHYGWLGEPQVQEVAEDLIAKKKEGWFNIAAVHHNVMRGEVDDNENLRDAEMLQRVLGDHIDLLLHGHTHRGKMFWWSPELPIVGTGSAALNKGARPEEIPNQYQIIKITDQTLSRYCRAFALDEDRWIPDARVGINGFEEKTVNFKNVHSAFPATSIEDKTVDTSTIDLKKNINETKPNQSSNTYNAPFKLSFKHYCDLPPVVGVWVGREKHLQSILSINSGVISITGIGGQGKSILAAKYLEQWKCKYPDSLWDWRDCREEGDRFHTQLIGQIERITDGAVGGEELSGVSTKDLVKYLFERMGERKCLFVFDNVDQYVNITDKTFTPGVSTFVEEALKGRNNSLILITCRPRIEYPNINFSEIYLNGLEFEDTIDLFQQRGVNIQKTGMLNTLNEVYTLTGHHPFCIDLLAIQISRNEKSSERILEELRKGKIDTRVRSMLRPIWKGLNSNQKQVLRCMAEIPRPMDLDQIHSCISGKIKTFNRFKRAFNTVKALSLIIECETDSDDKKYDLHALVRSFINSEYGSTKERLQYIDPIVCFFKQLITGTTTKISLVTSFDTLRIWSEKAELEIRADQMAEAVESLNHVGSQLLATGYSEELFRVGKRIINDFCNKPSQYDEIKEFDELFHLIIEALIEFGHETDARHYLNEYEKFVEEGTSRFIGLCDLIAWVEWHLKNYEEAIEWGEKGKLLKEQSSIDTSYDCGNNLALALRDSGRYDEALEYFLMGNSLEAIFSDEFVNTEKGGAFWGNIARCLMFKQQHDKAIFCLKKSSELLKKDQSAAGIKNQGYAAKWIAQCLEKSSKFKDAYIFYKKAKIVWDRRAPILSISINSTLKKMEQSLQPNDSLNLNENEIMKHCSVWLKTNKFSFLSK